LFADPLLHQSIELMCDCKRPCRLVPAAIVDGERRVGRESKPGRADALRADRYDVAAVPLGYRAGVNDVDMSRPKNGTGIPSLADRSSNSRRCRFVMC
jgi:hypothetical protein